MNRRDVRELLRPHVGHAVTVLDDVQLRCTSCAVTLVLDSGRAVVLPLDQLVRVDLTSTAPCPLHPGNVRRSCRGCRADRLAGSHSE